ncbi:hypothetical protein EKH57_03330 [Halorubrum sp. BOL3-1]|uniref:RNA ligase family protein n=1 Tax=Halorubrum sp. BOL3-1 TaxID=2497325 RepID=UPI001004E130|nr:RNA ligase family protein [Halorubrum sp. BOL3-1]QAU11862.1 hypothetical protein EKH57_03330 [Halorubrum sp. BOL3-1]
MAPSRDPAVPSFPPLPPFDSAAADDVLDGHLWVIELIDGTGVRFRMDESGLLRFAGPDGAFADDDAAPLRLRPAIRHVRSRFDREALRDAVDDPTDVAFLGVATHRRRIDYDWDRIPPFLGTDVWTGTSDRFRPPDAAAAIFEGTGLDAVDAIDREVPARDFDPDAYGIPESAWGDGPAAGVVVRNKRGDRGRLVRGDFDGGSSGSAGDEAPDVETLAAEYAADERLERYRRTVERRGEPATVDALADRVVEAAAREAPARIRAGAGHPRGDGTPTGSHPAVDAGRLRAVAVERVRAFLDERPESD